MTDASGNFSVNLAPGTYRICEVLQANWTQSFPNPANTNCTGLSGVSPSGYSVTVTSQSTSTSNNFGNYTTGSVSGQKWEDVNANGVKNAGDNGLSGWHIRIFDARNAQVGSDLVTDASGNFTVNLAPGTYRICEVLQAGWTQSAPANTVCQGLAGVAAGGHQVTSRRRGPSPATTSGTGAKARRRASSSTTSTRTATEPAILPSAVGRSGRTTRQGAVAASTITAADGTYTFSLNPGTYTICEVLQANWTQSAPSNTLCQGLAGDVAAGGYTVVVTSQSTFTGKNFGNWTTGSVSGQKWEDVNANGAKDAGDNGLANWHIRVFNAAGNQVGSDLVTDASGNFTVNLAPGTYRICEVRAGELDAVVPEPGEHGVPGLAGVSPSGYSVTVTSQSTSTSNNFGNYTTGAVSGQKWEDVNANGAKDAGDNGLANWHIRIFDSGERAGRFGSGDRRERQLLGEPRAGDVPDL